MPVVAAVQLESKAGFPPPSTSLRGFSFINLLLVRFGKFFLRTASRIRAMTHLSDDETVAKMGHPHSWLGQIWATRPTTLLATLSLGLRRPSAQS